MMFMKLATIVATALLVIFLNFSLYGAFDVGLEYDEVLSANAALGCPHPDMFVIFSKHVKTLCLPLMLSSYIGAPMAIIPKFVVTFFTPSVQVFRFASIVTAALSLLILTISIWKTFGKRIALCTLFFLVFDAQFLLTQRLDRTSVFPFFLKSIYFSIVFLLIRTKKKKQTFEITILGLLAGLSVYTKLDALFWIAPLSLAILLQKKSQVLWKFLNRNMLSMFLGGFFLGVWPFLVYFRTQWRSVLSLTQKLQGFSFSFFIEKFREFFMQLQIPETFSYIFETFPHVPLLLTVLAVFCVMLWFLSAGMLIKRSRYAWIGMSFFFFFLLYIGYKGLIFSYHRLLIYPIPQLALAVFLSTIKQRSFRFVIFVAYIIVFLSTYSAFTSLGQKTCGKGSFTCAIYPLFTSLKNETRPIVVGDWGIATQLLFLSKGAYDIRELAFLANQKDNTLLQQHLPPLLNLCAPIVLRPSPLAKFPLANTNIRQVLQVYPTYSSMFIDDPFNTAQYEVFTCK